MGRMCLSPRLCFRPTFDYGCRGLRDSDQESRVTPADFNSLTRVSFFIYRFFSLFLSLPVSLFGCAVHTEEMTCPTYALRCKGTIMQIAWAIIGVITLQFTMHNCSSTNACYTFFPPLMLAPYMLIRLRCQSPIVMMQGVPI